MNTPRYDQLSPVRSHQPVWEDLPVETPSLKRSQSIECPQCEVQPGEPCVTPRGKTMSGHNKRFEAVTEKWRNNYFVVRIIEDEQRFNLRAGDLCVALNYPLDSKVTILYRLSDGFEPDCNQYISNVRFQCWVDQLTPATTMKEPQSNP